MPPTIESQLWYDIQDIVGKASLWPKRIRELFWTKNIKHWDRILICCFVFVNGLNPVVFLEWCELKKLCRDQNSRNKIVSLLKTFEDNPSRYNYYAYNVHANRYETLGGSRVFY